MDDDNSKTVSYPEFTKALRETGVIIDEGQARKLFQVAFDTFPCIVLPCLVWIVALCCVRG
jgi:hypothetical protein